MGHKSLHESAAEILALSKASAGKEPVPMAALAQTGVDLGGELSTGVVTSVGDATSQLMTPSPKPGRSGAPAEPIKTLSPMSGVGEEEETEEKTEEENSDQLMEGLIAEHGLDLVVENLIAEYGDEAVFNTLMESAIQEFGEDAVNQSFGDTLAEELGEDQVLALFAESVVKEFNEKEFSDEEFSNLQEQSNEFIAQMQTLNEEEFNNYIENLNEEELIQAIQLSSLNEEYLVEFFKKIKKGLKKLGKGVLKVAGKVLKNPIGSALLSFALPGVGSALGGLASKAVGKLASTGLGKLVSGGVSKLASSGLGQLAKGAIGNVAKNALTSGLQSGVLNKISGGSFSQGFKGGAIGGAAGAVGGGLGNIVAQKTGSNFLGDLAASATSAKLQGGGSRDVKSSLIGTAAGGLGGALSAFANRGQNAGGGDDNASDGAPDGDGQTAVAAASDDKPDTAVRAADRERGGSAIPFRRANNSAMFARSGGAGFGNLRFGGFGEDVEITEDGKILIENSIEYANDYMTLDDESLDELVRTGIELKESMISLPEQEVFDTFTSLSEEEQYQTLAMLIIAEAAAAAAPTTAKNMLTRARDTTANLLGITGNQTTGAVAAGVGKRVAQRALARGVAGTAAKAAARFVPGAGTALGAYYAKQAWDRKDYVGAGLNALAAVPGLGMAFAAPAIGYEIARGFAPGAQAATSGQTAPRQQTQAPRQQTTRQQRSAASGAVGSQLTQSSGGVFNTRADRLNQSKVDSVLGKGKYKAGSAEANLALAKYYKSQQKPTMTESALGESVMENQESFENLQENAQQLMEHLSTLSEEDVNEMLAQLSEEEVDTIGEFLEYANVQPHANLQERQARSGGGRSPSGGGGGGRSRGGGTLTNRVMNVLRRNPKTAAFAGLFGVGAGLGAMGANPLTNVIDAATAPAPSGNRKPMSDEERYGKVGAEIRRLDPEAYKNRPRSSKGNLELLDQLRKKAAAPSSMTSTPVPPPIEDARDVELIAWRPEPTQTSFNPMAAAAAMTPMAGTAQDSAAMANVEAPKKRGAGLFRKADTGEKTALRRAIPNEIAALFSKRSREEQKRKKEQQMQSAMQSAMAGGGMSESLNNYNASQEHDYDVEDTMEQLTDEQIQEAKMLSIKEKVSQYKGNMREDVDALFNGESLSEEFRVKATLIFESAVTSRVEAIVEQIMNDNEEVLVNAYEEIKSELTEQVDEYLNYVVEQWMSENQVAVETGLRSELAEDFISGLRALFQEHYIEIPEEKVDVAETLANELAETQEYIEAQNDVLNDLQEELNLVKKEKAINSFCEGLTAVQAGKMKSLAESVEFTTEGDFEEKLAVLRENYFPTKVQVKSEVKELQKVALNEEPEVAPTNNMMNRYVQAIAKTAPKA